jgi:glycerol-3-phosphate acyltransferase PlsY
VPLLLIPLTPAALVAPAGGEWLAILAGYLLGSVPFGVLFARVRGVDLRAVGSGNIGATNVGRALGRPWALVAFVCDFGKGWAPAALIGPALASAPERAGSLAVLAGAAAACGHVWPVFLRLRGGKAVATWCGALVAIDPWLIPVGAASWVATLAVTRYVGLASIAMAAALAAATWFRREAGGYGNEVPIVSAALALLILWRHRSNIERMRAGTESHFGEKGEAGDG